MSIDFGAHSTSTRLCSVAVRRPPAALATADPAAWHYTAPIDLGRARAEHRRFVELLAASGADVLFIDDQPDEQPDSVFTYDASLVTGGGAVLFHMGKVARRPEADLHEEFYGRVGIPILGRVEAPGTIEGGDTLWVDEHTLAVGRGFRTNDDGVGQLAAIMASIDVEVVPFDLPFHHGAEACLHLMSLVSICAPDLALVHLPLMPVRLVELLESRGYELVVAPADEFTRTGGISCNVLATAPRTILMVEGAPQTEAVLRDAGCTVNTFPGVDICAKTEGGPTCLTRPLLRLGA